MEALLLSFPSDIVRRRSVEQRSGNIGRLNAVGSEQDSGELRMQHALPLCLQAIRLDDDGELDIIWRILRFNSDVIGYFL
jgi:hypothetical protein